MSPPPAPAKRSAMLAAYLLLAAGALGLTLPFWTRGIASRHDMLFHVDRLYGLERAIAAGEYYPRLSAEFGYGYGYPLFQYYAPLAAYVSLALRGLGLGYVAATKATFALALVLSATGAGALAWRLYARTPAMLLSGGAFVLSPYLLLNLYERGALAESLALGLEPWVLLAFDRAVERPRPGRIAAAGATLAALLLTHNVTSLFFAPVLVAAVLAAAAERRDMRGALGGIAAGVLGIVLAAIYWLPALGEKDAVQAATLADGHFLAARHLSRGIGDLVQNEFVFDYWGPKRFRLGLAQSGVFAAGLCTAAWVLRRRRWRLAWLVVVLGACVFAQLPAAVSFWERAPLVAFIQFPWRLLGLASLVGALLAGSLVLVSSRPREAWPATVGVLALMAGAAIPRLQPALSRSWQSAFDDTWVGRTETQEDLSSVEVTTGGFLPAALHLPFAAIPRAEKSPPAGRTLPLGRVRVMAFGRQSIELAVASPVDWELLLSRFHYPGWRATVDGRPARVAPSRDLALVGVDVPAGEHALRVWFGQSAFQRSASVLSGAGALAILVLAIAAVTPRWRRLATVFAVASLAVLSLVLARPATEARPLAHAAEMNGVRLIGSDVKPHARGLTLTLFWLALARPTVDYSWHVEAVPVNGRPSEVFSGTPGRSMMPTTRWYEGEVVTDAREMVLAPGRYRLYAGLTRKDGDALEIAAEAGAFLREVEVVPSGQP